MDRRCTRFIDEYLNCLNLSMEVKKDTNCFELLNEYKICNDDSPKSSSLKPTVKKGTPKNIKLNSEDSVWIEQFCKS